MPSPSAKSVFPPPDCLPDTLEVSYLLGQRRDALGKALDVRVLTELVQGRKVYVSVSKAVARGMLRELPATSLIPWMLHKPTRILYLN
jgi:hypothetical protein